MFSRDISQSCRSGLFLCTLVLALAGLCPTVHGQEGEHDILILHSYHPSFEWTRNVHDGIIEALDDWGVGVNLSIEYMDTKRLSSPEHVLGLVTLYEAKYSGSSPDLIICSDNNAFDLLYRYREQIFGKPVPVVFSGVNFFNTEDWPGMENILGVDERPDLEAVANLVDQLFPGYPPITFICDQSPTGKAFKSGYDSWKSKRNDSDRFHMINEGYPDDIMEAVGNLPDEGVLHYTSYTMDPAGNAHEWTALLMRLATDSGKPVFGNYDLMLDNGIIGGPMIDGFLQGKAAMEISRGVLEGTINPAVFQLELSPSSVHLDDYYLRMHKVSRSSIPDGAVVINNPQPFWQAFPMETLLVGSIVVILVIGMTILLRLNRQRMFLIENIGKMNLELEERVQNRSEELKKAESELIRAEKMSTLGSLVAGIAHEVNTPLGMVVTGSSYLRERMEQTESDIANGTISLDALTELVGQGKDLSGKIEKSAQRAAVQIRNFRRVAVDQTGEQPRLFAVREIVDDFLLSMRNELKNSPVQVDVDCPDDIVIEHYPGDLWRILANLLRNSLNHAFDSGRQGTIRIEVEDREGSLVLRFTDNGKGIPDENMVRIFDPFFSTSRQEGGMGLGLHVVYTIVVDRHGGSIQVDAPPGGGTRFTITLPRSSPALEKEISS